MVERKIGCSLAPEFKNKYTMKTLKDLFELVATATEQNKADYRTWFFDYHGHVNKMRIRYYFTGWVKDSTSSAFEEINQVLTEDGIQCLYYFIKTRLK